VVEPFVQAAKAEGMRVLINPFYETAERLSIATYFTSDRYASENPDVVERFRRALNRSLEYAQANREEIRQVVLDFTEIPEPVAETMTLPFFTPDLNVETIELTAERMVKYGLIDEEPNLDELIPEEVR
jgi:NitT/TauT family transport system substrate-binding protein